MRKILFMAFLFVVIFAGNGFCWVDGMEYIQEVESNAQYIISLWNVSGQNPVQFMKYLESGNPEIAKSRYVVCYSGDGINVSLIKGRRDLYNFFPVYLYEKRQQGQLNDIYVRFYTDTLAFLYGKIKFKEIQQLPAFISSCKELGEKAGRSVYFISGGLLRGDDPNLKKAILDSISKKGISEQDAENNAFEISVKRLSGSDTELEKVFLSPKKGQSLIKTQYELMDEVFQWIEKEELILEKQKGVKQ